MASRETRKKRDCHLHLPQQVNISNCISVFFLWIIIELRVRIHKDGFVSSLGDRQVFVSVGLYMKDGQISWASFHICHVSLHFLKWKITALSKNEDAELWWETLICRCYFYSEQEKSDHTPTHEVHIFDFQEDDPIMNTDWVHFQDCAIHKVLVTLSYHNIIRALRVINSLVFIAGNLLSYM